MPSYGVEVTIRSTELGLTFLRINLTQSSAQMRFSRTGRIVCLLIWV